MQSVRGHAWILVATIMLSLVAVCNFAAEVKVPTMEALPDEYEKRLENRNDVFMALKSELSRESLFSVIDGLNRWEPKSKITVAFDEGEAEFHKKIESVAKIWQTAANVELDFVNPKTKKYRRWSKTDKNYSADVRITLRSGANWSLIGKLSSDKEMAGPGEASMGLDAFDLVLPQDWESTVLHEFGHVLGFDHEHKNTNASCETEFRWEDDENGKGIYSRLGAPGGWSKVKIDDNLRKIKNPRGFIISPHDPNSIMNYAMYPWMFKKAEKSPCYVLRGNKLSDGDRKGAADAYPTNQHQINQLRNQRLSNLSSLMKMSGMSEELKIFYAKQQKTLQIEQPNEQLATPP